MKKETFLALPLKIKVVIANGELPEKTLSQLEEGDILLFEKKIDAPFTVEVENKPAFKAAPGKFNGYKAVKIERSIE